jgi:hypothetical protein
MGIKRNTMLEGSIDQEEELKGIKRKELIKRKGGGNKWDQKKHNAKKRIATRKI